MLLSCLRPNAEASCRKHFVVISCEKQMRCLPGLVSSTCHGPVQLCVSHLAVKLFSACDQSDIGWELQFLPTPPTFNIPVREFASEHCHKFGMEKLEWCGYTTVKKFGRYVYSLQQKTWTRRTPRRTDGRTVHDGIGSTYAQHRVEKKILKQYYQNFIVETAK